MIERTFSIIKPDAVSKRMTGQILRRLEYEGFKIVALKMIHITQAQAEGFYAVHEARPFFASLTRFMTEGPIVPMVLERENAVAFLREVMGATDPAKAVEGTIRRTHGESIERNCIHGSDAAETARFEIGYFFNALEIVG
jgi:nucleoside-diphosphate kinase